MADRQELRLPEVRQDIHVTLTGKDEVEAVIDTLNKELAGLKLHEFYKSERALIDDVREAYRLFEQQQSSATAKSLMVNINALTARAGKSIEEVFGSEYDAMRRTLDMAQEVAGTIGGGYSQKAFQQMFFTLDKFSEKADDVLGVFRNIADSSQVDDLRSQVNGLMESLRDASSEIERLKGELSALEDESGLKKLNEITQKSYMEFRAFLTSNNVDPNTLSANEKYRSIVKSIRDGTVTAGEAISKFKAEFSELLSKDASASADAVLAKFEAMAVSIEEIRTKVQGAADSTRGGIIDSEEADRDSASIQHESEAVSGLVSQSKGVVDITALISALVEAGKQATGESSNIYESILPVVQAVKDLSGVDTSKLANLSGIFRGLSDLNGFKVSPQQIGNLNNLLSTVSRAGDLGNLTKLSGLRFDGLNNIKIDGRGLSSFERLVAILDKLSQIDPSALEKITKADFSSLSNLKTPEISNTALTSLEKMSDAMIAAKDAANAMTGMLENAGRVAEQSGKKVTDVLSQGAIGGSARMVGINKTLSREEYLRGLIGRAEAAGFDSVRSEYIGDYNAVSYLADQYNKLREAIDKGTISQKEYNEKYKELEAVTSRESGRLKAAVSEYEKNKQITDKQRDAIDSGWNRIKSREGWSSPELQALQAEGIRQQEEYIANLKQIEEETARLQDASWRNEIDDYDAEEDARLAEEIGAKREEREKQLQKIQAESLQIAEQRRLEEEKQAETAEKAELRRAEAAAKADELAEQMANGRADAARRNLEQRQAEEQRIADAAKKAAEEASEAEYKRAEAAVEAERKAAEEITKLKALRIDYQDQIDRAGELGIDNDTVNGLRSQVSEIDRTIQELERVASGQGGMTAGMDAYKDSVKRARDELVLLKKQLSSDIKSTGAFVPMNDNQIETALKTIDTRRKEAEQQLQKAAAAGLDKGILKFDVDKGIVDPYYVLKEDLIPLYDKLEKKVKDGTISQKEYNETLRMLASVSANVNTELNPEIQSVEELTKQYQKLGESMLKSQDDARNGVSGAWAEATDAQKNALDDLIVKQSSLVDGFQQGTITGIEYRDGIEEISEAYNNLTNEVNREYQARNKAHKDTLDEMKARRSLNQEIGNATKLLRDYSAAEHSKNESSRDAYKAIQNSINGMNELGARFDRHEIDLKTLQEEESRYSNEIARNSQIIRQNGDDHMTAFGKIGRAIKTHLTTLTATASIGSIMRYIRQMVEAVREIDTAMTELRKVTDETDARYERFLDNAATRAKNLSATISDTVSATADFARLGLSIDEAEKAADAAIVYKAVGDDINSIGDAAESIISTMKAFGVEASDAMSIVDKFNKVGKQLCPAA